MEIIEKYSSLLQKEILGHYKDLIRICVDEYDKRSLALVSVALSF